MGRHLAVVGGGLLGRCPCVHPVLARTSQFTTRPAPQVKDLRHGQFLYSSCTVGSAGLLRTLQKRMEPTIGLEPMTCRFQIGRLDDFQRGLPTPWSRIQ